MKRAQAISMAALVLIGLGVGYLALRNRQPPLLPDDRDHRGRSTVACLACHGPGGAEPRGPNHPLGDDCFRCHGSR